MDFNVLHENFSPLSDWDNSIELIYNYLKNRAVIHDVEIKSVVNNLERCQIEQGNSKNYNILKFL